MRRSFQCFSVISKQTLIHDAAFKARLPVSVPSFAPSSTQAAFLGTLPSSAANANAAGNAPSSVQPRFGVRSFSFFSRIRESFTPKKLVGEDKCGNKYFVYFKDGAERRMIKYADGKHNPDSVPILWYSWLSHHRQAPPTPAEMEANEMERAAFRQKVEAVEKKDQERRQRELESRGQADSVEAHSVSALGQLILESEKLAVGAARGPTNGKRLEHTETRHELGLRRETTAGSSKKFEAPDAGSGEDGGRKDARFAEPGTPQSRMT